MIRSSELVVPVVEERVTFGQARRVRERVRIQKTVETKEVDVAALETEEALEVDRVPIGELVAEPPRTRVEGETTIIPVVEEVVVVEKRLLLREEVRVRKKRTSVEKKLRVPVRTERVAVEHTPAAQTRRRT